MNQFERENVKTAVVVDDNLASAFLLADFLRLIGHRADVLPATGVSPLVEAILDRQPDVVFLDLMLGRISGLDVARDLRVQGCDAYLIAVTGWGEPDDRKRSLDAGFDEHWTKPLDTSRVDAFMREHGALTAGDGQR
jgi:DNA-binding response OmpR family regulator